MPKVTSPQWNERSSAKGLPSGDADPMFRMLFERSADAILLLDPQRYVFVDCNQAAVDMMRATSKEQLLLAHPADLSPEFQPDGRNSREKTPEIAATTLARGTHRFEWLSRRFDGTEFYVEVLGTTVQTGDHPLVAVVCRDITDRKAAEAALRESEARFRSLFERSTDAMSLFDPETGRFIESNEAVARQLGAPNKEAVGKASPAEISPEFQPDGRRSSEKADEMVELALARGSHRFEWLARCFDAREIPLDIVMTAIPSGERTLLFVVTRDISNQKRAEKEILQLNASLEKRVAERTAELLCTNEQLRRTEQELRNRGNMVQKHRDVLLELARAPKADWEQAVGGICSCAAASLEVARVSYWSLSENAATITCERLYLRETQQFDHQFKGAQVRATDCPAYFEALATKRPIVANDVLINPATCGLADGYLRPLGISSMLDAPVWLRGEVVGVLCHEHIGPGRVWTAEEIDFVSALATMVSLAIEESRRAASEHLLRGSEEKFRALFEASSQGVILHDDEKMLEVNPSCLRILGFQRADELVGKHPADISAPVQPGGESAQVLARKHIQDCLDHGSTRFDWLARNFRGEEIPIEVILTRIQWGGKQIIQGVFNDIAARKKAESALQESAARLRESEARFSTAFHASPVLISISRLNDAKFIEANEAFVRWIGLSREEIRGRDSEDLGIWADRKARAHFLAELRRLGSVRDVECQMRSARGTVHTMLLSADLIDTNREPHILAFGLDITERKQADAEMLRALAREKELGQLRSNFVSMVSHEFRTPLGIIQSSGEILEDYLDQLAPAERKEHLQSIRKNAQRMAGLMEEVLLIGSIDAGKLPFKPESLDLRSFTRRLVDEVISATDRRCPIELALDNLTATAQADERLLRHIFTNLLTNAVKYSEAGKLVRFHVRREGTEAICRVEDRGIGIHEADHEWLFHAFHRGRNVDDRPGTGLGLVIAKRCLDLHGGKIHVESKLGEGTTMSVSLPLFGWEPGASTVLEKSQPGA